uniref:Putative secreted peptide n=1 Tax=Anopheles braziliensis TaxID=58242 RepID=A0A2M3ZXT6_9DIPT
MTWVSPFWGRVWALVPRYVVRDLPHSVVRCRSLSETSMACQWLSRSSNATNRIALVISRQCLGKREIHSVSGASKMVFVVPP